MYAVGKCEGDLLTVSVRAGRAAGLRSRLDNTEPRAGEGCGGGTLRCSGPVELQ